MRRRPAPATATSEDRAAPRPIPTIAILDARAMRGPSRWSRKPMIRLLVDLGELESYPTDRLPGFRERLIALLPGLATHTDAVGKVGGFAQRLEEGTWLGHVTEHVAIELQGMSGHAVTRGKTRSAGARGRYDVLYAYGVESVGLAAGRAAVALVNALVASVLGGASAASAGALAAGGGASEEPSLDPLDVPRIVEELRRLDDRDGYGPSTQALLDEARRRDIPTIRLDDRNLVQLGWGSKARRIRATVTDETSAIGSDLATNKDDASALLERAGLPVPAWRIVRSPEAAIAAARKIGYPVVLKPVDGNHGRGVALNLRDDWSVGQAFAPAAAASARGNVLVQQELAGRDHRLLVVGGRLVACAERIPAGVIGDGCRSVRQLVAEINADPARGDGHDRPLTKIRLDEAAIEQLSEIGLLPDDVPALGQWVQVRRTANISTGGTAVDRTGEVHPEVARVAEMAAALIGLDIAGVDVVTPDITRPLSEVGGGIVEVNAAPGFRMHTNPTVGRPRNVAKAVLDHLFPNGEEGRIPLAAVTGTNGKTTTTRMLAHIVGASGKRVGYTSTDGIVVDGWTMKRGDLAGPSSCRLVLSVPTIDAAVLEVARGGILREGLGYDWNDVAVVTNVSPDHLGLDGVDTIDQMAAVKAVIVEAVPRRGTAVLNADDPVVLKMASKCRGRLALTTTARSSSAAGPRAVAEHVRDGGLGGTVEEVGGVERLVIRRGSEILISLPIRDVPATWRGAAWMNVSNALQAACAGLALGIAPSAVERGLRTFQLSFESAPGRLNRLTAGGAEVLIDYAHNIEAMKALATVVDRLREGRRTIGVISVPGDRRPEDQRALGALAGTMFDDLFVCEPNLRGRPRGEVAALLIDSARDPSTDDSAGRARRAERFDFIADEVDAAVAAVRAAAPGDLVVLCVAHAEPVYSAIRGFDMAVQLRSERPRIAVPVGDAAVASADPEVNREPPATSLPDAVKPVKAARPDDRLGPGPSVTPTSKRSPSPATPDGAVSRR